MKPRLLWGNMCPLYVPIGKHLCIIVVTLTAWISFKPVVSLPSHPNHHSCTKIFILKIIIYYPSIENIWWEAKNPTPNNVKISVVPASASVQWRLGNHHLDIQFNLIQFLATLLRAGPLCKEAEGKRIACHDIMDNSFHAGSHTEERLFLRNDLWETYPYHVECWPLTKDKAMINSPCVCSRW